MLNKHTTPLDMLPRTPRKSAAVSAQSALANLYTKQAPKQSFQHHAILKYSLQFKFF